MICQDWITPEQLLACECPDPADPEVLQRWIDAAQEIVYLLSGSMYSGVCTATWRPQLICTQVHPGWGGYPTQPLLLEGNWYNAGPCGCGGSPLHIPFDYPRSVTKVMIDGAEIPATDYRLDTVLGKLYLVSGRSWPHRQDMALADTEPGTFSITLTYGLAPPAALVQAAIDYAVELGRGCSGLACRLPARAVSIVKQGVAIDLSLSLELLNAGKTGIISVDTALATFNPTSARAPARFYSPDLPVPLG